MSGMVTGELTMWNEGWLSTLLWNGVALVMMLGSSWLLEHQLELTSLDKCCSTVSEGKNVVADDDDQEGDFHQQPEMMSYLVLGFQQHLTALNDGNRRSGSIIVVPFFH